MSSIDIILALTDQVESLIADGKWSDASVLEAKRREMLVSYVECEGSDAPGLRELHDRSVQSIKELKQMRTTLSGAASHVIGKSRAVDAYLNNAGARSMRRSA
jgi:hypothetical protein